MLVRVPNRELGDDIFFRSSWPKMIYDENGRKTDKQETTAEGVPVWSVKADVVQGEKVDEIKVAVPMKRNPAEGLMLNEKIQFVGMVIESGARRSGGRWECLTAERVVRAKRGE